MTWGGWHQAAGTAYAAGDAAEFLAAPRRILDPLIKESTLKDTLDNSFRWLKAMMKEIAGLISI